MNLMERCIQIAAQGEREVTPNPMVGCVITKGSEIKSEGFHEYYGGPHAEVNALLRLTDPTDCTLYVSLEPCTHFGKTPPCVDRIISSGIKKVIIGALDPKNGGGARRLAEHGIQVKIGVLEEKVKEQNFRFFCAQKNNRPYIILKWAESSDGFIAPLDKSRVYLSSNESNKELHKWRSKEAGILVGSETVLIDNPKLDTRLVKGRNPTRIVLDRRRRLLNKRELNIFNPTAPVLLFGYEETVINGYIYTFPETKIEEILNRLLRFGIDSIIVEGGAKTLSSFLPTCDEIRVIRTPKKLFDGIKAPIIPKMPSERPTESDIIIKINNS